MARLTNDEWTALRAEWEASPQQGITWLTKGAGGRWAITEEAIRRKRIAENWIKRGSLAVVAEKAQLAADRVSIERAERDAAEAAQAPDGEVGAEVGLVGSPAPKKDPPTSPTSPAAPSPAPTTEIAVDLRARLLERHRDEWKAARRGLYASLQEAQHAKGFEVAKFSKINSETMKIIQEGERKAWGLEAQAADAAQVEKFHHAIFDMLKDESPDFAQRVLLRLRELNATWGVS